MADVLRPVAPEERIRALDLLRGWAMFGVLWSNLNDNYGTRAPVTGLDHALSWTQNWLIEGRFYSLLILLFGIGFGIQLTRADSLTTDLRNTYYRRSAALLAIGIVHGTLIWQGDILTIYALVAFALVMFRTASTGRILVAALLLWFVGPTIVQAFKVLSGLRFMLPNSSGDPTAIYSHGTWLHIERVRVAGYMQWLGRWGLGSYVSILASFLVGLWAVRSGYLRRVIGEPRVTRSLLAVALGTAAIGYAQLHYWRSSGGLPFYVSIPAVFLMGLWAVKSGYLRQVIGEPGVRRRLFAVALGAAALWYAQWQWADTLWPQGHPPFIAADSLPFPLVFLRTVLQVVVGYFGLMGVGSAVAYACVLLLIWQRPRGERLLRPLAAAGRMALTTYLTQSIVCTLLFYGYGLGWYGSVGFTGMLLITLILFGCQMAVSTWWLARFRYGPAEWLWRTLTYGRAPEMRVAPR